MAPKGSGRSPKKITARRISEDFQPSQDFLSDAFRQGTDHEELPSRSTARLLRANHLPPERLQDEQTDDYVFTNATAGPERYPKLSSSPRQRQVFEASVPSTRPTRSISPDPESAPIGAPHHLLPSSSPSKTSSSRGLKRKPEVESEPEPGPIKSKSPKHFHPSSPPAHTTSSKAKKGKQDQDDLIAGEDDPEVLKQMLKGANKKIASDEKELKRFKKQKASLRVWFRGLGV